MPLGHVADPHAPCYGKVAYVSGPEAAKAKPKVRAKGKLKGVCVYRCKACGAWHLGRQPKEVTKFRKARR